MTSCMLSEIDGTVRYSSPQHTLTNITKKIIRTQTLIYGGAGKTALPTYSRPHGIRGMVVHISTWLGVRRVLNRVSPDEAIRT